MKIKENTNYLNLYLYSYMTVDNHHHYVYNRHHRNYIIENFNQSCSQTMYNSYTYRYEITSLSCLCRTFHFCQNLFLYVQVLIFTYQYFQLNTPFNYFGCNFYIGFFFLGSNEQFLLQLNLNCTGVLWPPHHNTSLSQKCCKELSQTTVREHP